MNRRPSNPNPSPWIPTPGVIAVVLFVVFLILYSSALPASITWKNASADGGELAIAVETLGVPHPPGYPTYVLLGRAFRLLPVGELAYRLAIMSAVAGAAAVGTSFLAALYLVRVVLIGRGQARSSPGLEVVAAPTVPVAIGEYFPALVCAAAVGLAPLYWGQAIVAEVYSLNALFASVVAVLLLGRLQERPVQAERRSFKLLLAALLFWCRHGQPFHHRRDCPAVACLSLRP